MQQESVLSLTVLGARGSMPREGKDFALYGGSTSCYLIRAGEEEIYLDAGSGIAGTRPNDYSNISILITHMHLDHIIGLPFFSALAHKNRHIDIYAAARENLNIKTAFDRLVTAPFWPITIGDYPAEVKFHDLPSDTFGTDMTTHKFSIGKVSVMATHGTHPNGSTIFRLTYDGKSVVYATDFEHTPISGCDNLIEFSKDSDFLLYDAQYTEEEYEKHRGYGHSTAEAGLQIAAAANVKRIMFVHHAPWRTDEKIAKLEEKFVNRYGNVSFAKIGDKIVI